MENKFLWQVFVIIHWINIYKILGHNYTIVVYIQEKSGKGFKQEPDQIYSPGTFLQNDEYGNISNNTMAIGWKMYLFAINEK